MAHVPERRWAARATRASRLGCALLALVGCGPVRVEGNFEGVPFLADGVALAVVDAFERVGSGERTRTEPRPDEAQTFSLLLSGAHVDPARQWSRLPSEERLDLALALATRAGVLLEEIPLAAARAGDTLDLVLDAAGRQGAGAFRASLVAGTPDPEQTYAQGLGAAVTLELRLAEGALEPGALARGSLEIKRERAPTQAEGEVATGAVMLHFEARVLAEPLGEANLDFARPVLTCAAARGPVRAGGCIDAAGSGDDLGASPGEAGASDAGPAEATSPAADPSGPAPSDAGP